MTTVRDLRRAWKPHKERLVAIERGHPTHLRFHRACSWLAEVEAPTEDEKELDRAMLYRWIAFNALYGRWNADERRPEEDRTSWSAFLNQVIAIDANGRISDVLIEHKALVMSLLDDEYLSKYFWEDPTPKRAGQSKKAKFDARTWYLEGRWAPVLDRTLERIYLMRCQLVHGGATFGGGLNRDQSRRCTIMLGHLLPAVLTVWADHGADEDWGPICYPPMGVT